MCGAPLTSAVMRECVLILALSALVGCSAPRAGSCRAWSENRQSLANQATYFQPANSTVSAEARASIAEVASYMRTNPSVAVRVEGHGDGRGTERQNYELGDRRAEALREELVRLGVDPARIDTVACGRSPQSDRAYVPGAPRKWHCAEFVVLLPPQ
jgi:outer membrane protein OmpA-like peptidoglycan-associated protein